METTLRGLTGRFTCGPELVRDGYEREHEVFDRSIGRQVVMRELLLPEGMPDPERRERERCFLDEMRLVAMLQHAGAPTVHEIGRQPSGGLFALLAPVQGPTLRQAIGDNRTDRPASLLPAVLDACRVIAHAHAMGVVHGDLSPGNVRLRASGGAVVVGWARARRAIEPGDAPVDPREDLRALGEMILEILRGGGEDHPVLAALARRARSDEGSAKELCGALEDAMLGLPAAAPGWRRHLRLVRGG